MGEVALAGSIIDGILQVTSTITNGVVKSKEMKYGAQVQVSENEQGGKSNRLLRFITKCSTLNSKQEFTKELPKNYQGTTNQLPNTKNVRLLRFAYAIPRPPPQCLSGCAPTRRGFQGGAVSRPHQIIKHPAMLSGCAGVPACLTSITAITTITAITSIAAISPQRRPGTPRPVGAKHPRNKK